jgi:hypothetical protein
MRIEDDIRMSDHVYARLVGYGLSITPYPGFRFERIGDSDFPIRVFRGEQSAILESGTQEAEVLGDVADVALGPTDQYWVIETTFCSAVWLSGYSVQSDQSGPPGYYLEGPSGTMIYTQGPIPAERIPPLEQMHGEGQRIAETGETDAIPWVHLIYEHEGVAWVQRHYLVMFGLSQGMLVTVQAHEVASSSSIERAWPYVESLAKRKRREEN